MPPSKLKTAVKKTVKHAARLAGPFARRGGARILTYHSVGSRDHEMNVDPGEFRRQLEWLKLNAAVISFEQAAAGENGVAITFDDGYLDNHRNAAPMLAELELPATFFVVAERAGKTLDHDKDTADAALMDWPRIRELQAAGFEIGCHTNTHQRLARLDRNGQRQEIAGAKEAIEQQLGVEMRSFAYPFGSRADYDETSVMLVRQAGFCQAASNRYGVNFQGLNPFDLKRIWVDRTDGIAMFKAKVTGGLDALALLDSPPAEAARRLLNRLTRQ